MATMTTTIINLGHHPYVEGHLAPIVIETLFHVHHIAAPLRDASAVHDSVRCLLKYGLIEPWPTEEFTSRQSGYKCTPRGDAYVEAICALPFPKLHSAEG